MARQPRLDAAGILHHVIIRGIERRRIFLSDDDRNDFLDRCGTIFPETKTSWIPYLWQDTGFILSAFGSSEKGARRAYLDFLKEGLSQRSKLDLDGGGLIRSHGGWAEVAKSPTRLKGDVRVLGGSDLPFIERRVLELLKVSRDDLYSRGRQKHSAEAKGLLGLFAVRELGMSRTELSELLHMT